MSGAHAHSAFGTRHGEAGASDGTWHRRWHAARGREDRTHDCRRDDGDPEVSELILKWCGHLKLLKEDSNLIHKVAVQFPGILNK